MTCVLLIEDDPLVRESVTGQLEQAGYHVVAVRHGGEGISALAAQPVDLIITDILMPVKEGIETILEIRRQHPRLQIIAMSGGGRAGNTHILEMANKLGASATLAKPFTRRALLDTVERCLAGTDGESA